MLSRLALLVALGTLATATIIPFTTERKIADGVFLKRQKLIFDLYMGVGDHEHFESEHKNWNMLDNLGSFDDEKYPKLFMESYHHGFLDKEGIFTITSDRHLNDSIKLFDVFYFAKDFDTFYKAACWARAHVQPALFFYSYTLALYHRPDCQSFYVPPFYEVMPMSYVPIETMHKFYDSKMLGVKETRLNYNNTGYEHSHENTNFGGLLGQDNKGHSEYRVSYLTEDVGFNSWYTEWLLRNPTWYCNEKYNKSPVHKRGENFYDLIHTILARFANERVALGLPWVESLSYRKPIKVGYNPRVTYVNGQPMYIRPNHVNPFELNEHGVRVAEAAERRVWEVVDAGILWELENKTQIRLTEENGIEILGRIIYGSIDRPSKRYYLPMFRTGMEAIAYMISTASDRQIAGGALSGAMTALRDPVMYKLLTRFMGVFQHYKHTLGPYRREQLMMDGVTVQDIEIDKFLTYFEKFEYEVTNGVAVKQRNEREHLKYLTRQFRLNHKPYRYTVTINSDKSVDAMVRVFIGASHDPDYKKLSMSEARLTFFEIDRFPVALTAGENQYERTSSESPLFVHDSQGMRALYNSVNNAMNQKEQFYVREDCRCGIPARLQLPMGWKGGRPSKVVVVVTPFDKTKMDRTSSPDIACGGGRLDDHKPQGFPFDRPADFSHVQNLMFKDVLIHHKDTIDINRSSHV